MLAIDIATWPIKLPMEAWKAIQHFKYRKARDEFGMHLIESLKMLVERYDHVKALLQTHKNVMFLNEEFNTVRKVFKLSES